MSGPYRDSVGAEVLEAPAREGRLRLEIAPRHVTLELPERFHVQVTDRWVTMVDHKPRVPRPRSLALDGHRLVVARALPTDELSLWYQVEPRSVARLVGVRPPELLDQAALSAWQALGRLADRLREALVGHSEGVSVASELGRGGHRVLLLDHGSHQVLYARSLFRKHPRRVLEVRGDGTVLVPGRNGDERIECRSQCAVTVLGDRIRFDAGHRGASASVWLPWIADEDRLELARRFGRVVGRAHGAPLGALAPA